MTLELARSHWAPNTRGPWVIAGGWIRDTLLGVPPKDIDFFVRIPHAMDLYRALRVRVASWDMEPAWSVPGVSAHSVLAEGSQTITDRYGQPLRVDPDYAVISTNRGYTFTGEQINIVIVELRSSQLWKVIDHFDFTVNAFSYDCHTQQWHHGKAAMLDLMNKRLRPIAPVINADRESYMASKGFSRA